MITDTVSKLNLKTFAIAASLAATPALAQEKPCEVIKFGYDWQFLHVSVEVNKPANKLCIGLSSEASQIASITPSKEKPFCWDLSVDAAQVAQPIIVTKDGDQVLLPPMDLDDARKTVLTATKACIDKMGPTI